MTLLSRMTVWRPQRWKLSRNFEAIALNSSYAPESRSWITFSWTCKIIIYKKVVHNLITLFRVAFSIVYDQRTLIWNSFIKSHVWYCPIAWMYHSYKLNEVINLIHERALRIVSLQRLSMVMSKIKLWKIPLHPFTKEIYKKLLTEISIVNNGLTPEIMKDVFYFTET